MAVPQLSTAQTNRYNQQRSAAGQNLLTNQANTLYNRQLNDLQFKNNLQKFKVDWGQQRQGIPRNYTQRGIFNSGLYQQGLQDYGQRRLMGLNDLATQNQLGNNNYTMQSRGYEDDYARTMMGSYNSQFADKADLASQLRNLY